jgi:choline kinase
MPLTDMLVIEADVVFDGPALGRLLAAPHPNATLVAPFTEGLSGSAVVCGPDGVVCDWLHASHQGSDFRRSDAAKTINITRLDGDSAAALLSLCLRVEPAAPLEYALRALVQDQGAAIRAVTVGQALWWEVDTPEDLRFAERLFAVDFLVRGR